MNTLFNPKTWLMAIVTTLIMSTAAIAADRPNILIMLEDVDKDTVPRNSAVAKRALNQISNQLHDKGFDVYDETAVTLDNFAQGRVRRTDAEMIDIAKSVRHPSIDVVVFYSITASANAKGYTTKVKSRVDGRMLQVQTGQRLGNIELSYPNGWNAPAKCNRTCIIDTVGDHTNIIAADVGAVITKKLAYMVNRAGTNTNDGIMAYSLIFDGFTKDEVLSMEEYLVIFSGYKSHKVEYSGMTRTEYWYKSDIGSAKLDRNLHKMMDRLDLEGMVQASGNTYTVKKIGLRGKESHIKPSDW